MGLTQAALRRRYIKPNLKPKGLLWAMSISGENPSCCPFYSQENELYRQFLQPPPLRPRKTSRARFVPAVPASETQFFRSIFPTNGASIWCSAHCFLFFCSLSPPNNLPHIIWAISRTDLTRRPGLISRLEIFTVLATIINACSEEIQSHLQ